MGLPRLYGVVCTVHSVEERALTIVTTPDCHAGVFVLHQLRQGSAALERCVLIDLVDLS
jgi:hypothetical protein